MVPVKDLGFEVKEQSRRRKEGRSARDETNLTAFEALDQRGFASLSIGAYSVNCNLHLQKSLSETRYIHRYPHIVVVLVLKTLYLA